MGWSDKLEKGYGKNSSWTERLEAMEKRKKCNSSSKNIEISIKIKSY